MYGAFKAVIHSSLITAWSRLWWCTYRLVDKVNDNDGDDEVAVDDDEDDDKGVDDADDDEDYCCCYCC